MYDRLIQQKSFGIDTETTSLDPHTSKLLLISIAFADEAYVIDMIKLPMGALKKLKVILEDKTIRKIGHNLTFEWKVFYHNARIEMEGVHDTMIIERMLFAGLTFERIGEAFIKRGYGLKDLIKRRLGIEVDKKIRESFLEWIPGTVFTEAQLEYSAMDSVYVLPIYEQQMKEIATKELERIYNLEMAIIAPTGMMEYVGVYVNRTLLQNMVKPFERFVKAADRAFQDILIGNGGAEYITFSKDGYSAVNINSPKAQVLPALQRLGINIESLSAKVVQRWDMLNANKKRKKNDIDWDLLNYHELLDDEDVADALDVYLTINNKVLRAYTFYKGAKLLLSTFIYGILDAINPVTGRVHPGFNSYGAQATGRYSSSGPNFQNLPNNDKLAMLGLGEHSIRYAIEAPEGRKLIIADYAGIELTILAANSGDEKLMEQILRGDIHTYVVNEVLGNKEVTAKNKKEQPYKTWRDASKTLSYGIAYGTTGRNIAETMNIKLGKFGIKMTNQEGDALIAKWYGLFPKTAAYLRGNANKAVMDGFVTDAWGRRRQWDRRDFTDKWKKLAAEREGQNMPIQGTSSTMTKLAVKLLWERLDRSEARIIFVVHDEIVVESTDDYVEEASRLIKNSMEQAISETLPVVAKDVGKFEGTSVSPSPSRRYDK